MRKIIYLATIMFTLLTVGSTSSAQNGLGRISGNVLTEDDKPAEGVTVNVIGSNKSVIANEAGRFSFIKLTPGCYTLRITLVGNIDVEETVIVNANQTSKITIKLSVNATRLNEVVILCHKNSAERTSSSLRLATPILETPQNIQVVDKNTLNNQQIIGMSDGLISNVSGATRMEHWGDLYANISVRGSQIQAFRSGFNVFNILDKYLFSGSYYDLPTVAGDWSSASPALYYKAEPPRNVRLSLTYQF